MAYIVVEGNIGAGKSTFLRTIGAYFNAQCVYEPHSQWQNINGHNLLDAFYKDSRRWAYSFQTYVFITRVCAQQEEKCRQTQPLQLVERSVFSDRFCFAYQMYRQGLMDELEWHTYTQWFDWFVSERMEKPAGFIYLRTSPEVCFERMCERNRYEEVGVSQSYIRHLHDLHERWLNVPEDGTIYGMEVPVLVLDCDVSFEESEVQQRAHVRSITSFLERTCALSESTTLTSKVASF